MRKKGITPLIAWVLLISFSVVAGLLVVRWAVDEFSNLSFGNGDDYCNQVQISIDEVCVKDDYVRINFTNKGSFSIRRLGVLRETTNFSENWCTELSFILDPGNHTTYNFKLGTPNSDYSNVVDTECSQLSGGINFNSNHNLTKLSVVPWIKIEDEAIHCLNREITLNNPAELNNPC